MSTYEANRYNFNGANLSIPSSAIPNLDTAKITSGTFDDARFAASNITQHVTATTQATGSWTPTFNITNATIYIRWARYWRFGNTCTAMALCQYYSRSTRDESESEARISSLPVTSANTGNYAGIGIITAKMGGITAGKILVPSNSTYMTIAKAQEGQYNKHGNPTITFGQVGNPAVADGMRIRRIDMWDNFYGGGSQNVGLGWFNFQVTYNV